MRVFHHRHLLSPFSSSSSSSSFSIRRLYMTHPRISHHSHDPTSLSHDANLPSKRRRLHHSSSLKMTPPSISLSQQEETVRQLLIDVCTEIDAAAPDQEPIVLRFTGGWVRDKLLGVPSHDIDVGINRMTGFDFANYLAGFLGRNLDRYNIPPKTIYKIESNPEKSKHLETATTKILGLDIDLVNLRSEVYNSDSRIPEMEFGTPVQDALRRDCTVNALFYNLHSQQVEDFTGRGLEDMKNKVIRTPLPPFETFNDDPLRVLRLIRFSGRLDFEVVPEAKEAMQHPDIKSALRLKISRERIGTEVEKMLKGRNPFLALTQIHVLSLYDCIFAPPLDVLPPLPTQNLLLAISALSHILSYPPGYPQIPALFPTRNDLYIAWILAALAPWEGYTLPDLNPKKKAPGAATAVREGLKATNRLFDTVARSYNNTDLVREGVRRAGQGEWARSSAGILIKTLGADWKSQVLCGMVLDLVKAWKEGTVMPLAAAPESKQILENYNTFIGKIYALGVEEAHSIIPILNGKDLQAILGAKAGPWLSGALSKVLDWQWQNPQKDKEAAIEWVKESKEELLPKAGAEVKTKWKKKKA